MIDGACTERDSRAAASSSGTTRLGASVVLVGGPVCSAWPGDRAWNAVQRARTELWVVFAQHFPDLPPFVQNSEESNLSSTFARDRAPAPCVND